MPVRTADHLLLCRRSPPTTTEPCTAADVQPTINYSHPYPSVRQSGSSFPPVYRALDCSLTTLRSGSIGYRPVASANPSFPQNKLLWFGLFARSPTHDEGFPRTYTQQEAQLLPRDPRDALYQLKCWPTYCCTNNANRSRVGLRSTFSNCHVLFCYLHSSTCIVRCTIGTTIAQRACDAVGVINILFSYNQPC